jgi:hypothetical protein
VVGWALAVVVCLGAVAAGLARLGHVQRALAFDPRELARALGHRPSAARLSELARAVADAGPSWEADVLGDIVAARSSAERRAAVNLHLLDLEHALGWGSRIPAAAARIGLFGPLFIAFLSLARGVHAVSAILSLLCWALVGLSGPLWAGRLAGRLAEDRKAGTDVLIQRALEAVDRESPAV